MAHITDHCQEEIVMCNADPGSSTTQASIAQEGTPPAVETEADNKITTTTTCKEKDKSIEADVTPPAIEMGTEADATYSKNPGTKRKAKADNLDGTSPANKMETDNVSINESFATAPKEGPCKADNPQNAIVAGPMISRSSAAIYMDALLDAMSPECKALIIMPPESPVAKACKPLNPAFRKGMQKIGDRRFRALEAAYSGHNPLDYFEADIDKVELPPLKQNVVTLVFLYVLDDYGYVLDADFKVFDDEGSNSAWDINKKQTLEADGERSYRVFEGCGDSGTIVTPRRIFPKPRRIDRDFNVTIWGSPDLPAAVRPPEKIKSRLPVPAAPKVKAAVQLDKDETISVTPPRALATLASKTMIPIFPATPRSKAVNKVGLSKKAFSQVCGKDPSIPLPPIRLVWGSAQGNLRTVPTNAFESADGPFVPAPGVLTGFSTGSVLASASTQVSGPSNVAIARRKPAPVAPVAPKKISVGVSDKRPSASRLSTAALVKKAPVPMAPKKRIGSGISTELSSRKQRLAKDTKDGKGHVEKRGVTIKNAVVEKEAIKKRPSSTRLPARSKGPRIPDELSDPQSPSPAYNNAVNSPSSFTASNLEKSSASMSASSRDNAVPKEPILAPTPANREGNAFSEDLIKDSANNADIANLRSDDEESSADSETSPGPKSAKKRKPPRRRRPRIHGAVSQHSHDAGDTPTAEVSPQDNAAPVHSSALKGISAPEEPSSAEAKIGEPVSPTLASKVRKSPPSSPKPPPSPAPIPSSSLDLAGLPEASATQVMCLDAKPSEPARAIDNSIHQRDLDLKGLRQEMDEELDKKLSAQAAGFEAMLKATIQTTVNGLTGEFNRKLDLQAKSLEDSIREKDAKISLQEAEIEALKAKLRLLEETKFSASQGSSAADDENQVGDNTEAAAETEDDEFFDAEEGTPEPAPLSSSVATKKRTQEPEIIHLPGSKPAIWQRVQPKLRWLLVGTFVVLAIIAALRAFVHSGRNEELPIPALPSFNTKEARLYLERLIRQGIGRREIANIAPYLQDLEEILTSIPTRTYNMPTQTYDLGLMDSSQ